MFCERRVCSCFVFILFLVVVFVGFFVAYKRLETCVLQTRLGVCRCDVDENILTNLQRQSQPETPSKAK